MRWGEGQLAQERFGSAALALSSIGLLLVALLGTRTGSCKDEYTGKRRRTSIEEDNHSLKRERVEVTVEHCATDYRGEVEEDKLCGDHNLAVKLHKRAVQILDLPNTSQKKNLLNEE